MPVSTIHAIFWDVGGVLLTNAWDHTQRMAALEHFRLDEEEFHSRHEMVISSFERGKISLDEVPTAVRGRFKRLDKNADGVLTPDELEGLKKLRGR